jgi:hypothetical protein
MDRTDDGSQDEGEDRTDEGRGNVLRSAQLAASSSLLLQALGQQLRVAQ